MKKHLITSILMTAITTLLLGLIYPLVVTAIAQVVFPEKANGQLMLDGHRIFGSRIIGQPFTGNAYFHSRPSAAGGGYDAASSGGSNLGPTSKKFVDQVTARAATETNGNAVPIDLVTASASGLDPHITPAGAEYQITRIARARGISESELRKMVARYTEGRQFGLLGEPRVNVLELNLELDRTAPAR
jgi:potassium-transporting ATPase KdpC subunit